jgi:hypothetical protein
MAFQADFRFLNGMGENIQENLALLRMDSIAIQNKKATIKETLKLVR